MSASNAATKSVASGSGCYKLSKLSGAAFNKAYAHNMVNDHTKDVADFKKEASDGTTNDIKNFASQALPTLEEHLKMAREMLHTVSASTSVSH